MLVLSRKEGQRIVIGSGIEIVVTEVRGNRVKLGITAPPEVPIHRKELRDQLKPLQSCQPLLEFDADEAVVAGVC